MKHFPAILFIAAAVLCGSVSDPAQAAPILDFAVRVGCDFQQPERGLMDLHILQGSTPLVLAMPQAGNTALTPDTDTSVRMIIGPSETGSIYAVRTNYAIAGGGYAIDWPTIGTNSSGQAWFYTLLFDREGKTYWSGSGALYIDASGYSGPDGVDWIEYTTPNVGWANVVGDPADNAALVQYVEDHGGGSAEDTVARAAVAGVESNLTAHADNTDNPHGVTAGQLGALTEESDPAWSAWEPEAHVPIVCSGGYYFPDYFTLDPKPTAVSFTSYGSTQDYNSVVFQWRMFSAESGFALEPDISRQEDWDDEVAYSDPINLEITVDGESAVATWLTGATTGTVGSFVATLGDFSRLVEVTYTASESTPSSNAYWLADLPGSLRENINSNTLAAASASGVESNLYNSDAYATTNFVRNADCWAADFDLTCASPWNSYSGRYRAGTLVTSQHVAYAVHYTAPTGTVFRFVDATNGVHDRTLVDQRLLAYDIAIGLLDEPLGAEITPAKVLGMDQIGYLRGRYGLRDAPGLRLVCLDKHESAWLAGSTLMETVSGHRWESPYAYFSGSTNLPYSRERAVGGDSGNPIFMIVGGETTLLSTFYSPTSGPFLPYSRTAIETAIADMGGSVHTNLTAPDLSAWEDFDAGQDLPDF